ncbi:MAG: TatD family hydrolase [Acidobacteriota bacterium]
MTYLSDTHCHIHDSEFFPEGGDAPYLRAREAGVPRVMVVGTDLRSSREAVAFAHTHDNVYAVVGIHPHEATTEASYVADIRNLAQQHHAEPWFAGIGEIGLDYFYLHSPRELQQQMLREQLDIAAEFGLPVSFHVRNSKEPGSTSVFDDFWPIFDAYDGLRGVLHSFTDTLSNMQVGLSKGLYVGLNGISTFATDVTKTVGVSPLDRILFETDAPYLTPKPHRGKINEPMYIRDIALFHAKQRGLSLEDIAAATEQNFERLFFAGK